MTISGIGEKQLLLDTAFKELCDGLEGLGFSITLK
jgi:hypothetical protein